jgi:adenylyl-sulfate kinase
VFDNGFTLWFTGLSGSGKSTLADRARTELVGRGRHVEILDGDEMRRNLSDGLGFSKEDRDRNVRRIGYVARLLSSHGIVAIAAAISPYRAARDEARRQHQVPFIEVFVECGLDELIRRDPKGLYASALRGEISNFTGISDPYEPPLRPEITVHTGQESVEDSLKRILEWLERNHLILESH